MRRRVRFFLAAILLALVLSGCDWRFAVFRYFHDTGQEHVAECIVRRESGGNPNARNPSGASGLFQIMLPLHGGLFAAHGYDWQRGDWTNPFANAQVARDLYNGSGWAPWNGGNYRCF